MPSICSKKESGIHKARQITSATTNARWDLQMTPHRKRQKNEVSATAIRRHMQMFNVTSSLPQFVV